MERVRILAQDYLLTHSFGDLYEKHHIRASIRGRFVSLNYHQLKSTRSDPVSQQCRGAVLLHDHDDIDYETVVGETQLLAWPFNRFFNFNEGVCADIDWTTAEIQEKLDGSLCFVYYNPLDGQWEVATRKVPQGNLPINPYGTETVRDLFLQGLQRVIGGFKSRGVSDFDDLMNKMDPFRMHTWMFELTSPVNRIVCVYNDISVTLLGRRNLQTGRERSVRNSALPFGIPIAETYDLKDLNAIISFVQRRPPHDHEGIVVCDAYFNRIKVKSEAYVLANKMQGHLASSPQKITSIILEGGWDDVSGQLPDYIREQGDLMSQAFGDIVARTIKAFREIEKEVADQGLTIEDKDHRKTFALAAKARKCDVQAVMNCYGQNADAMIEWFHYRDGRKPDMRGRHVKRIRDMIKKEMERNGTSRKAFWEIQEDEEE